MEQEQAPRRRQSDYEPQVLSKAEIRDIFEEVGQKLITSTFDNLGVDIQDPKERHEVREDFSWVRSVRKGSADAAKHVRNVGLGAVVLAVLASLATGFKIKFGGG
jgi:hypothetical protein